MIILSNQFIFTHYNQKNNGRELAIVKKTMDNTLYCS